MLKIDKNMQNIQNMHSCFKNAALCTPGVPRGYPGAPWRVPQGTSGVPPGVPWGYLGGPRRHPGDFLHPGDPPEYVLHQIEALGLEN